MFAGTSVVEKTHDRNPVTRERELKNTKIHVHVHVWKAMGKDYNSQSRAWKLTFEEVREHQLCSVLRDYNVQQIVALAALLTLQLGIGITGQKHIGHPCDPITYLQFSGHQIQRQSRILSAEDRVR